MARDFTEELSMAGISWFYLAAASLCSASLSLLMRFFSSAKKSRYEMILGNYLTCSFVGFLLIKDKMLIFHSHPSTYLCGLIGGILFVLSLLCMQHSIETDGAILTSAFSKLGLLVPLLLSIVVFGEKPALTQAIGLCTLIAAIFIFSYEQNSIKDSRKIHLFFLLIVLLTGGAADAMAKVYDIIGIRNEDSVYILLVFFFASILTFFLSEKELKQIKQKHSLRDLAYGVLIGIPNYFSSVFLLKALNGLPAFIVYPVFSCCAVIIVTLLSQIFFHEVLSRRQLAGLILILVSLALLNL